MKQTAQTEQTEQTEQTGQTGQTAGTTPAPITTTLLSVIRGAQDGAVLKLKVLN